MYWKIENQLDISNATDKNIIYWKSGNRLDVKLILAAQQMKIPPTVKV